MYAAIKALFATVVIAGSATFALADDGTDGNLDTSRTGTVIQAPAFKSSKVLLSQGDAKAFDHAGANADNGGN